MQGSHSSVVSVTVLTAKVIGLGFDPQWLPITVCFYADLPPVPYHQFSTVRT